MERKAKSFKVGIAAPEVTAWTPEQWRTFCVQVDRPYLPFRAVSDLLSVLNKAQHVHGVTDAIVALLQSWAVDREKINTVAIAEANFSQEEAAYVASIEPTIDSLKHRTAADLALVIGHLVDANFIKMEDPTPKAFSVAGELKRIDFLKSNARKKCRK